MPYAAEVFSPSSAASRFGVILAQVHASSVPGLIGDARWQSLVEKQRSSILNARTHREYATAVNELFAAAGLSHFGYFTHDDWRYWFLLSLSLAYSPGEPAIVDHVGIIADPIDGKWRIRFVLEGSAAAAKPMGPGDELVEIGGRSRNPVVRPCLDELAPVSVCWRSSDGKTYFSFIEVSREPLITAFERSSLESIRLIEHEGTCVVYLHAWTLTGEGREYDELSKRQDQADGLVLDLRDGFGGHYEWALQFLFGAPDLPLIETRRHANQAWQCTPRIKHWTKPVVLIIDQGTRSAKEIVAQVVKARRRGLLVGRPTAGHVIGGQVLVIAPDALLQLPHAEYRVGGRQMEGNPVEPDISVDRTPPECGSEDAQLQQALDSLIYLIRGSP